jgi:hypothetical protein
VDALYRMKRSSHVLFLLTVLLEHLGSS